MKEVNVHELKKMLDAKDDFQLIEDFSWSVSGKHKEQSA